MFERFLWCIQLFRERLSEKSTKVHATRPKSSMGKIVELLHVLNTIMRYNDKTNANLHVFCLFRRGNKVRLATLNFRRILLTQRHATVKEKLQINSS